MIYHLFNNHFTFYISFLGMNYSNVIGFCLFILFIIQFNTGFFLSFYYSPFFTIAFSSVYYMMIDVNVGWLIRLLHVLGASLFMVFILIHILRGTWMSLKVIEQRILLINWVFESTNNMFNLIPLFPSTSTLHLSIILADFYTWLNLIHLSLMNTSSINLLWSINYLFFSLNLIWVSGWMLLISLFIEGFLGYMLNWGQMSYWGITVMINIVSILPFIGSVMAEFIMCSSNVIINRIFVIHFIIGFFIGFVMLIHLLFLHSFSSSNPLFNSSSSIIILFYNLLWKDFTWFWMFIFSLIVINYSPFSMVFLNGSGSLVSLYDLPSSFMLYFSGLIESINLSSMDPLLTPSIILPEWYFLIFHCCLSAFPNKIMGVIMVMMFLLLLILY